MGADRALTVKFHLKWGGRRGQSESLDTRRERRHVLKIFTLVNECFDPVVIALHEFTAKCNENNSIYPVIYEK